MGAVLKCLAKMDDKVILDKTDFTALNEEIILLTRHIEMLEYEINTLRPPHK